MRLYIDSESVFAKIVNYCIAIIGLILVIVGWAIIIGLILTLIVLVSKAIEFAWVWLGII